MKFGPTIKKRDEETAEDKRVSGYMNPFMLRPKNFIRNARFQESPIGNSDSRTGLTRSSLRPDYFTPPGTYGTLWDCM